MCSLSQPSVQIIVLASGLVCLRSCDLDNIIISSKEGKFLKVLRVSEQLPNFGRILSIVEQQLIETIWDERLLKLLIATIDHVLIRGNITQIAAQTLNKVKQGKHAGLIKIAWIHVF